MNTYVKISFEGKVEELNEDHLDRFMREQLYGSLVMFVLERKSKKYILNEFEYETMEELNSFICETISFVGNTPNYQYGHKYKPHLKGDKKYVLKKLDKLLKEGV